MKAIRARFPSTEIEFQYIHPWDHLEHAALCAELGSEDLVILPERPLVSLAMENGVRHVAITPNGLMELVSVKPELKPL